MAFRWCREFQSKDCLAVVIHLHVTPAWNQSQLVLAAPLSIGRAIAELLAAKRQANRRERYTKSLSAYLLQFSRGREETPLASFTTADVESWLNKFPSAWTRKTWFTRLSTLFSFAVRRGYLDKNPCDRIERVTTDCIGDAAAAAADSGET